jgi:diguanylate cyclase (GGDEF)-like protein
LSGFNKLALYLQTKLVITLYYVPLMFMFREELMADSVLSSPHLDGNLTPLTRDVQLNNQTLMIVDDYHSNLQALNALFESHYRVVLQDNAKDAIAYAIEYDVDLILLDVDMPEMSGHDACAALKSNPETEHIPIIFVTAADTCEDEEKGLLLGAVDYIGKPVNLAIMRARVKNHMELIYNRKKLETLSYVDGLTGVANRRQLDIMLHQLYASAIRFGQSLSLLMIDVDDFKSYNDIYGHTEGDLCLKKVAQTILLARRRESDVVGRYGGEEFAVILPDTDLEGGITIANQLLSRIRKLRIEHSGNSAHKIVTVSIGLAVLEASEHGHSEMSLEDFVQQSDRQLYKAKHNGKNCVSHTTIKAEVV